MAKMAQKAQELGEEEWRSFPRDKGKFVAGHHYGGGRTGCRNKLSDAFIAALHDDFQAHGVKAIVKVRTKQPASYIKVIASLLPKDVNLNLSAYEGMTDAQIDRRLQTIKATLELRQSDKEQTEEISHKPETSQLPALTLSPSVD